MAEIPSLVPAAEPAPASTEAAPAEVGHKVFAGNLAYTTTDEGLKAFFAPVQSDIISAQVIYRGTRSAGYGFVAFKTLESAQKAVAELDKKELDGRTVIIEIAKPAEEKDKDKSVKRAAKKRAGRRGGKAAPPGEVSEAEANGTAATAEKDDKEEKKEGAEGKATKPKKKKNPRKPRNKAAKPGASPDGTAAAAPAAEGAAPAATTEAAEPKKKAKKTPRAPRPPRPVDETPQGEPSQTMLFVANLGFSVDDAGLSDLFTSAGINVVSARVVRRRWGQPRRSKGYGFVDVGSAEEQKKAIESLQGVEVGGREIAVKIAVNAPPRDDEKGEEKAEEKRDASPETTVVAT